MLRSTDNKYPKINSVWKDSHGHMVRIMENDTDAQKVIYQRVGYEWDCQAPVILFNARFVRVMQ
ncbi:DUF4222 domain-containing protein [Scandinavium goeteborgense]|uniref:DUF4222 domain-containing protein n=1 Tax=Scandinavium goeteborgense TaxID=1851514 RepID=UPI0035BC30F8